MASIKSRRDLVLRTLDVLGISAVGQPPAAEDVAAVDGQVDAVLAQLAGEEVAYVSDPDEIPAEWFNPLADILSDAMSTEFGLGSEEKAALTANAQAARSALRFMNRGRPTGQRMTAEYF